MLIIKNLNLISIQSSGHIWNHEFKTPLKRPSHGKLKFANSCSQIQVGVCEQHKNSRQTRQTVGRLFLCCSHTPT